MLLANPRKRHSARIFGWIFCGANKQQKNTHRSEFSGLSALSYKRQKKTTNYGCTLQTKRCFKLAYFFLSKKEEKKICEFCLFFFAYNSLKSRADKSVKSLVVDGLAKEPLELPVEVVVYISPQDPLGLLDC